MINNDLSNDIRQAVAILKQGGVIAYPTEAVYGLGCDPFNEAAVQGLLTIKQRSVEKGLILIAANWEQIKEFTLPIPEERMQAVKSSWPGPYTWLFPASDKAPAWIKGNFDTIALRITDHPVVQLLCLEFGGALVSTSANLTSEAPAKSATDLSSSIIEHIDFVLNAPLGQLEKPTVIRDARDGKIIRH